MGKSTSCFEQKNQPFEYAKIGYKYLTETLTRADIKVSQS